MQTYYVIGNLTHDGKAYKRGDEIQLESAEQLLEAGIVSTEPVTEAPAPAAPVAEVEEATAELKVGGERPSSGEPSLDGSDGAKRAEATDITPEVSDTEADKPVTEAPAPARRGGRRSNAAAEATTDKDPSEGL